MPTKKIMKKKVSRKKPVKAVLETGRVITEDSNPARELYNKGRFGIVINGRVQLNLLEAAYLVEKKRVQIKDGRRVVKLEQFLKLAQKTELGFWVRYCVFRNLRDRGYIVKTALKFGADFRVYDRGVKPGEGHARWIAFPVAEKQKMTWQEFAAKTRVAHSTKKRLLICIVDDENDVTYYEIKWTRP